MNGVPDNRFREKRKIPIRFFCRMLSWGVRELYLPGEGFGQIMMTMGKGDHFSEISGRIPAKRPVDRRM